MDSPRKIQGRQVVPVLWGKHAVKRQNLATHPSKWRLGFCIACEKEERGDQYPEYLQDWVLIAQNSRLFSPVKQCIAGNEYKYSWNIQLSNPTLTCLAYNVEGKEKWLTGSNRWHGYLRVVGSRSGASSRRWNIRLASDWTSRREFGMVADSNTLWYWA